MRKEHRCSLKRRRAGRNWLYGPNSWTLSLYVVKNNAKTKFNGSVGRFGGGVCGADLRVLLIGGGSTLDTVTVKLQNRQMEGTLSFDFVFAQATLSYLSC